MKVVDMKNMCEIDEKLGGEQGVVKEKKKSKKIGKILRGVKYN
jgi:hypothetical protein